MYAVQALVLIAGCSIIINPAFATEPPSYTAIDITDWSSAQIDTLPFFKHRIVGIPDETPYGFVPVAASHAGHIAGSVDQGIPYAGEEAVLLRADARGNHAAEYIDAFGVYSWSYWTCDSTDCHYNFGYVRDSVPSDMNWAGDVVGRATVTSSGDYSSQAIYHAFIYDADLGRVDLFPDYDYSSVACINNRREIAGYLAGFGAFRRLPDGSLVALDAVGGSSPSPRWMNANGVIIGSHYPSRAFASVAGSATFDLPDLGGFDTATANDLNDSGWIVGRSGNFGDLETFATIWQPQPDGTWIEHDLVELLDTPDVLLESAAAIDNTGNIIAYGHEDGTDFFSSRIYWLVPNEPIPGWCTPDIGLHPRNTTVTSAVAEFRVVIVNEGDVTTYQWRCNGLNIDPEVNPSASMPILELSGLTGDDSGTVYDCVITSDCGSVTSEPVTLTVEIGCAADLNADGQVSFFDVSAFLSAYNSMQSAADFNNDGEFDFFDVSAFLTAFNAGCP